MCLQNYPPSEVKLSASGVRLASAESGMHRGFNVLKIVGTHWKIRVANEVLLVLEKHVNTCGRAYLQTYRHRLS